MPRTNSHNPPRIKSIHFYLCFWDTRHLSCCLISPRLPLSPTPALSASKTPITMNPYVSDPDTIPAGDRYADMPSYGRYYPKPGDFTVEPQHVNSEGPEASRYWASVIAQCTESNQIYPADEGGRDVFALGTVIIKSSHLHEEAEIDYSYADANEIQAINLARSVLKDDIRVPEVYFSGKVNGRKVLVQERLPGVGLNVAWPYLSLAQRESFKAQAREILHLLDTVKPPQNRLNRGHVVEDPDILTNGRINPAEGHLLFANLDQDLSFMHNDLTESNIIVADDKITGLIDWEMAGFIGWKTAGAIHRRVRTPQREHFANVKLSEERLQEILWWNNLYD